MERLTYKNAKGEWCVKNNPECAIATCSNDEGRYYIGEPIDRLAELEDELENDTLLKLPAPLGSELWTTDRVFRAIITSIICAFIGIILIAVSFFVAGETQLLLRIIGLPIIYFGAGIIVTIVSLSNYISDKKVKEEEEK